MPPRSTAGCYTCKRRKKKCDETQPHCLRCVKSGKECEGYAPLESPDSRGIMRRGKVAPDPPAPSLPQSSETPDSTPEQPSSSSPANTSFSDQRGGSDPVTPPLNPGPSLSQSSGLAYAITFPPPEAIWPSNPITPTSFSPAEELYTGLPAQFFESPDPDLDSSAISPYSLGTSYLIEPQLQDPRHLQTSEWPNLPGAHQITHGLAYGPVPEVKKEEEIEDQLEVKQEMYIVPVPDPNVMNNTLPFILQCYARWINLVVFEPAKAFDPLRDTIINKFNRSPTERHNIILLANAIGGLGGSLRPSSQVASLITYLRTEAYQSIYRFIADKPASDREEDQRNALEALDLMMEVVLIQRYSNSMLTIVTLMEAAGPIFRRACPEPMDQYVNLPRAIMSPAVNIRHFATTDIIMSITTGRPMIFRYDTEYPPGILDQIKMGYGMQWLHGIADQYIVILARINVLFEEFGANISPQQIAEIEDEIRAVDISERVPDPVSTIWKFTVRECWKATMYIYLYMVLCRTTTADARVMKLAKTFVRVMEVVKPGRNPDSFLYIPLIIVGAAAYRHQDRAVIQRRMANLQECENPGSCGYDALNMLIDLWRRTDAEGRPGTWHDLRMSAYRVTGI